MHKGRRRQGMYSGSSRVRQSNFQASRDLYTLAADTAARRCRQNDWGWASAAQKYIASYYILGYYSTNERSTDISAASRSH